MKNYLQRITEAATAEDVQSVAISVEWKRNATWGYNPTVNATIKTAHTTTYYTGHASGCGYDKETAAIAEALNQSASIKKMLYTAKENALKTTHTQPTKNEDNRNLIHYGATWRSIEEKQKELEQLEELQKTLREHRKTLKAQRSEEFNTQLEKLIHECNKQLKELSSRIHVLKIGIQQQEQRQKAPKQRTDSAVYKKYGKKIKDLSPEEFSEYNSRKERRRRKQERAQA